MFQKLSSVVYRLSSLTLLFTLPACHGSTARVEPLITAEKLAPSASPKPVPKVEQAGMVTYHLEFNSAGKRWSEMDPKPSVVYSSPPTEQVRLGWIDSANVFQSVHGCTSSGKRAAAFVEVEHFECDVALPLKDTAIFAAMGMYLETERPVLRFIPVNEPIVAGKQLSATLTVKVGGQLQLLKPVLHTSWTPLEAKQTFDWHIADQWVVTTSYPERLRLATRAVPPPSPSAP